MYRNILVAVDGSDHSVRALREAEALAETFESRLILVHACRSTADIVGSSDYSETIDKRRKKGQEVLEAMRSRLSNPALLEAEELLEGPEAEAVVKAAKAHGADLVVIGTRGLGAVASALVGSVSRQVSQEAPCSVLLAR